MNKFPIMIRREFWEHRNTFVVLPGVVAGFLILLIMVLFFVADGNGINITIGSGSQGSESHGSESQEWTTDREGITRDEAVGIMFSRLPHMSVLERETRLRQVVHGLSVPFFIVMSLVVLFYLLGSLYEDRKDRSILFWKSLPVSDFATVAVKLFTALVAVPAVYLVCTATVQFVVLLIASLAAIGHDIGIYDMLWAPSNLVSRWFVYIAYMLVQGLWALPLYGWLMLVSAFARSVPLVWFLGVPFAVSVVEGMVTRQSRVGEWLADHASPTPYPFGRELQFADLAPYLMSLDTFIGVLVGAGLLAAAVWLRGRGDEI